ncbi:hypothetical protein ACFYU8_18610 [Brevibacillus sp. NPDC003359]|uniref:hypothetical protein n=1 Tax=unclassified Brevibacillus TaxID=2684853 RepID=UPI0036D15824
MKKIVLIVIGCLIVVIYGFLFFYLSFVERKNEGPKEVYSKTPVKQLTNEEKVRNAIHSYYDGLLKKDYLAASEWLAVNQLETIKTNRADWSNQMQIADQQSGIERKSYKIKDMKPMEDKLILVNVILTYDNQGEERANEDQFLVIEESGGWRLDFTGILKEETPKVDPIKINNQIYISGLTWKYGIQSTKLYFNITNLRPDKALRLGVFVPIEVTIHTSEGDKKGITDQIMIPPKKTSSTWVEFENTNAVITSIQISPVYWTDIDGVVVDSKKSFPLLIPLKQSVPTQ